MSQNDHGIESCVLVQSDGQYHMEQRVRKNTKVFSGVLRPERLAGLTTLINESAFVRLLQDGVQDSLQPSGFDELMLSVPKANHWITLRFLGAVNERVNRILEPFLKWNADLLKNPHKKLNEGSARNNCLPPSDVELKPRP